MSLTPGDGAAFSHASDGDLRNDSVARARFSLAHGVSGHWATPHQVHGADVLRVERPGEYGDADALWTTVGRLPVAVFTADCFGVVIHAEGAVGVAHSGWRGAKAGVVSSLIAEMRSGGFEPASAEIGPGIASCCFEVGPEVSALFPEDRGTTTWGTESVDLPGAITSQLEGLEVWRHGSCTFHDVGWFSHRRDRTHRRLAAVGWLP
jgi:hypothetical protein